MMRVASIFCLLLCAHTPALAQGTASTLGLEAERPIAVNADTFAADLQGESGTYSGNVVVTQGQVKLRADEVTVAAPGGRATRMEANGNVVVDTPSGTAVGNSAVYDVVAQIVTLSGDVALTNNNNIMRGSSLVVEVETGRARLTGSGDTAQNGTSGRVQGLFVPQQGSGTATGNP